MTENKIARPIEFRAWRIGKMYGPHSFGILLNAAKDYGFSLNALDKVVWEQFTGLTDCDGMKIFEGDIVEFSRYWIGEMPQPAGTGEVVFDDGAFQIGFGDDYGFELTQNDINDKLLRVIGNIHEQAVDK